jgi:regulator of cell morphogenesis and NO signaling
MRAVRQLGGVTVGELARGTAHAADWLRACGIDPGAAGNAFVLVACADAGIDPRELADGLSVLASAHVADAEVELDRLCRYIVLRHHEFVRRHVPHLQATLDSLPARSAVLDGTSLSRLFASMAADLNAHLAKEEHILFPAIEALAVARRAGVRETAPAFVTLLHPIRAMEGDHARVERALDHLRAITGGFMCQPGVDDRVHAAARELDVFDRDFQQHVRLENELLFPRALELERALA